MAAWTVDRLEWCSRARARTVGSRDGGSAAVRNSRASARHEVGDRWGSIMFATLKHERHHIARGGAKATAGGRANRSHAGPRGIVGTAAAALRERRTGLDAGTYTLIVRHSETDRHRRPAGGRGGARREGGAQQRRLQPGSAGRVGPAGSGTSFPERPAARRGRRRTPDDPTAPCGGRNRARGDPVSGVDHGECPRPARLTEEAREREEGRT